MKKIVSIVLALVMMVVVSVTAFAAPSNMSKATLTETANGSKAPADVKGMALNVIANMSEAQANAVDVTALQTLGKDLTAKATAGTLTAADVTAAEASVNAALNSTVKVSFANVSINTATGAVSADIQATGLANGAVTQKITTTQKATGTTGGTSGVIKTTGFNASSVVVFIMLAVAGVLGMATVQARKVRMGA